MIISNASRSDIKDKPKNNEIAPPKVFKKSKSDGNCFIS